MSEPEKSPWDDVREGPAPEAVGWSVISYLITGPVLLGGAGWALDALFGTNFLIVLGLLAGMALSMYVIWIRYGTQ